MMVRLNLANIIKKAGFGIQLTPQLVVSQETLNALQKAKVLGFDLSSKGKAVNLMMYNVDKSLQGVLADMTDEEFQIVMNHVQKSPPGQFKPPEPPPTPNDQFGLAPGKPMPMEKYPKTMEELQKRPVKQPTTELAKMSMRQIVAAATPQLMEFFKLLVEAGFAVEDQATGRELLSRSISNPQAQLALALTPQEWDEVVTTAVAGEASPMEEVVPPVAPPVPTPSATPVEQPIMIPSAPAQPASRVDKVNVPGQRKLQVEFQQNYDEKISGMPPEVKRAQYGDTTGIKILGKSGPGVDVAKGGQFVKAYKRNMEDAMVVGSISGKLAVLLFPGGILDIWDPVADEVRVSMSDPKTKRE